MDTILNRALTQPHLTFSPQPSRYTELSGGGDTGGGIEAVWMSIADKAGVHRVLPDGRCDIILRFCATARPINSITIVVTGPTTRHYDVLLEPGMGFAGIRLRPGFLHAILGLRPMVLRDGNLVGEAAIEACAPLSELGAKANSPDDLPGRLVAFVRHRIALGHFLPPMQALRILSAFHASGGRLRVKDVARMQGISTRTVQRIVQSATGLSPKSYARILQFHRALRLLRDHRMRPSEAAFEAGYADQAHMTNALRDFGGLTSTELGDVTLVTLGD
ncbi:helix-turn-helix domain-containing protein [Rhizobium oryzicola]|uniref:AraC family transcriptional regulator n=1 Tax=Rhizobium oryzicola TaxID=1232668 RepID=A0ABT8T433_9HYPH|nr:AraC family transcriptional regulator [Rhizobium oryzicola]MDO1585417.1 AraC family transcriptional regulator [Rhizobium oryzicola]